MSLYNQGRRGAFIDIGANHGEMILNLMALDFISFYVGFEPDPIASAYIQELVRVNHLTNYYVLPIALGNDNKNCMLYRNHAADDTATLAVDVYPSDRFTESILVPVSTADDQLKGLDHQIFLVKIDTEGWELQVLNGMEITLRDIRPPVYFEVMGYRHFLDGRYSREFHGHELSTFELHRLVENRRENMSSLHKFWQAREYTTYLCRNDGTLHLVQSLDPGQDSDDNLPEMNYLAVAKE